MGKRRISNRVTYRRGGFKLIATHNPKTKETYYTVVNMKLPPIPDGNGGTKSIHRHYNNQNIAYMVLRSALKGKLPSRMSPYLKNDVRYLMYGTTKGGKDER